MQNIKFIENEISTFRQELLNHEVYQEIQSIQDLQLWTIYLCWDEKNAY